MDEKTDLFEIRRINYTGGFLSTFFNMDIHFLTNLE